MTFKNITLPSNNKCCHFKKLPNAIFFLFQSYLSYFEYYFLVNSNKQLFQDIRLETIRNYFELDEENETEKPVEKIFELIMKVKRLVRILHIKFV